MKTTYGQRGGEGATAGKKKSMYEATLPDGRKVKKGSFFIHTDTAFIGAYEHDGVWYAAGVVSYSTEDGRAVYPGGETTQRALPARRIK